MTNHDEYNRIFVSVFDVELNGQISLVSRHPDGIDIPPTRDYTIGMIQKKLVGFPVRWPRNTPKTQPVVETVVFVISSEPVNLQFLAGLEPAATSRKDGLKTSSLHDRLRRLVQGISRYIEVEEEVAQIRYDIVQLPFAIEPAL